MEANSLIGTHAIASLDELSSLAVSVAQDLLAGDIILLFGMLGAGKTSFTAFLGEALGVSDTITSPTYALMNEYPVLHNSRIATLVHIDLYRAGDMSGPHVASLHDSYMQELIMGAKSRGAVVVIEWADMVRIPSGMRTWRISFDLGEDKKSRFITIER